jgi:hypothetical protein
MSTRTSLKLTLCVGSVIAALLATQPANAFAFGHMGGLGGGMPQMGGLSHMGGMSQMGGMSHIGGLPQTAPISHLGNLANGPHIEGAKQGELPVERRNVADRNVGGGMKERAGTATHSKDGRPIGGSAYDPETGNTTTSVKTGNGTHAITITDKNGKTIATGTSGKEPSSASVTDGKGNTTTVSSDGNGTHTISKTDDKGNTTKYVSSRPPEGHASVPDGHGGWRRYVPGVGFTPVENAGPDVDTVPDLSFVPDIIASFGPPNSASAVTPDGTTVKVTGIGNNKTVTRTDKDGKVQVVNAPAAPAAVAAPDIGTAVMNLINAMKALQDAKAESRSAHLSLDSIVNSNNLPDDVKANIPDAIDRAQQADQSVKAAMQGVQNALIDLQQQVAAHG